MDMFMLKAFLVTVQLMLIQQWIVPILKNSKIPFSESNPSKIIERLLKLAVSFKINILLINILLYLNSDKKTRCRIMLYGSYFFTRFFIHG